MNTVLKAVDGVFCGVENASHSYSDMGLWEPPSPPALNFSHLAARSLNCFSSSARVKASW